MQICEKYQVMRGRPYSGAPKGPLFQEPPPTRICTKINYFAAGPEMKQYIDFDVRTIDLVTNVK